MPWEKSTTETQLWHDCMSRWIDATLVSSRRDMESVMCSGLWSPTVHLDTDASNFPLSQQIPAAGMTGGADTTDRARGEGGETCALIS